MSSKSTLADARNAVWQNNNLIPKSFNIAIFGYVSTPSSSTSIDNS